MKKVEITNTENMKTISLNGHFTAIDHDQFRMALDGLRANDNVSTCIVDLTHLDFIDSGGLGMLLLLRDECLKQKIALSLNKPNGDVMRILDIAKFDQLFNILE